MAEVDANVKLQAFTKLVAALPADSDLTLSISAADLRELLADIEAGGFAVPSDSGPSDDLTVAELAEALERSPSAARSLMPQIEGAYKLAGRWRLPLSAWNAFTRELAEEQAEERTSPLGSSLRLLPTEHELARRAAANR